MPVEGDVIQHARSNARAGNIATAHFLAVDLGKCKSFAGI